MSLQQLGAQLPGQLPARMTELADRLVAPDVDRAPAGWRATGSAETDAADLACFVRETESMLALLPARTGRDTVQQRRADAVHNACRRARAAFLDVHADHVYRVLTDDLRLRPRVAELALAAADRFPGLVPTAAQLDAESSGEQAAKEGREIDQGLFFGALLRSPLAGPHLMDTMLTPTARALALLDRFSAEGELDLGSVEIARQDGVAHVTMTNRRSLNAEDNDFVDDMETAVDLALLDPQVHVGVLRGGVMTHPRYAGKRVFSAGINLKHLHAGRISYTGFLLRRELGYLHKLYRGLLPSSPAGQAAAWPRRTVQKPWVGAVDTFAIGGGAQVTLVLDHVIAASDTFFSLPAAQEGIVPGVSNLRLDRMVGGRTARRILLQGERIPADSEDGRRLFSEVVPPGSMDTAVALAAEALAAPAVEPNRRVLHSTEEPVELLRAYLAEFAVEQAFRLYAPDVLNKVGRYSADRPARGGDPK